MFADDPTRLFFLVFGVSLIVAWTLGGWLGRKYFGAPSRKERQELQGFARQHSKRSAEK